MSMAGFDNDSRRAHPPGARKSPALAWVMWVIFAVLAAVWVSMMVLTFVSRTTVSDRDGHEVNCYSLAENVHLRYLWPNVATGSNTGQDEEYKERSRQGEEARNAVLGLELDLVLDGNCQAQRANDSAKLNFIGIMGATTLVCWTIIATRRPRVT